jgi:hypothetical protein
MPGAGIEPTTILLGPQDFRSIDCARNRPKLINLPSIVISVGHACCTLHKPLTENLPCQGHILATRGHLIREGSFHKRTRLLRLPSGRNVPNASKHVTPNLTFERIRGPV